MKLFSLSVGCFGVSVLALLSACGGDSFTGASPPAAGAAGASGNQSAGAGGIASGGSGGSSQGGAGLGGAAGTSAGAGGLGGVGGGGQACQIGQFMCQEDVLFVCNLTTRVFDALETCGVDLCNAEKGRCDDCVANEVTGCLNETTQKICNDSGTGEKVAACPKEKPFCQKGGECIECRSVHDCPSLADECFQPSCIQGVCSKLAIEKGALAKTQTSGDCKKNVCDGAGNVEPVSDVDDKHLSASDCEEITCSPDGVIEKKYLDAGTPCGGGVCNGSGICGVCIPGSKDCQETNSVRICQDDGTWGASQTCPPSEPACSVGACVGIVNLASGKNHSCAVLSDSTVRCWGSNLYGQLGIGDVGEGYKTTPTEVVGLKDVKSIVLNFGSSCALTNKSKIFCWGLNSEGGLGVGNKDAIAIHVPTALSTDLNFVQLSSKGKHVCAVNDEHKVLCWGDNDLWQCGNKDLETVSAPMLVDGLPPIDKVAAGGLFSCALSSDGHVFCWGRGYDGELGLGIKETARYQPKQIPNLPKVSDVFAGDSHAFASVNGQNSISELWLWGDGKFKQNLASCEQGCDVYGATKYSNSGHLLEKTSAICPGYFTTSFVFSQFALSVGKNTEGQIGNGKKVDPSQGWDEGAPESLTGIVEIAPGDGHMCARQSTGKVWCWGQGDKGQLGNGDTAEQLNPVEVKW